MSESAQQPNTEDERDPHDVAVDEHEQPFLDHLIELRSRILKGLGAVGIIFIPIYYFANDLYEWISAPLTAALPEGSSMIATQVATPFLTPLKAVASSLKCMSKTSS